MQLPVPARSRRGLAALIAAAAVAGTAPGVARAATPDAAATTGASATAAATVPAQHGPWETPTIHQGHADPGTAVVAEDGTQVVLASVGVMIRRPGATDWQNTGFHPPLENWWEVRLFALPDGSVQLTWLDRSDSYWNRLKTAVLAPGATQFSSAEEFVHTLNSPKPVVAGNAAGRVMAAWYANKGVWAAERTADGGWSAPVMIDTHGITRGTADLSLAVAPDGTALVTWDARVNQPDGTYTRQYRAIENTAAGGWGKPADLALGTDPVDVRAVAHPEGGFHMIWQNQAGFRYGRKAAGATAWGAAEAIGAGNSAQANPPLVLPNGDVFVVGADGKPFHRVRSAATGRWTTGQRFPDTYAVSGTMRSTPGPDGSVVVAWSQGSSGPWLAKTSTYRNGSWSVPTVLNNGKGQHNRKLALGSDGAGRPYVYFELIVPRHSGPVPFTARTLPRGLPAWRDFTDDGRADLLGLSTGGSLRILKPGTKGVTTAHTVPGWSKDALVLPFGDLDGDRCNDVFVRLPGGEARMYTPVCGGLPSPGSAHRKVSSDWSGYDAVVSPGDVTGDGRADLLARSAASGDVYLYANDGKGGFASRVKAASAWNGYRKLIAAGDLDRDGRADLLGLDSSNELWRLSGTGKGTFKPRALVFKDWGTSYKDVVGGLDVTGDGRPDLVSRDSTGHPWLNPGNGTGGFGGRTAMGGAATLEYVRIS
ncbi:FG-GAP repeat domain-containing protein [Streptomyces sp. NPDC086023]|uniref:FG-GAP repeat domain-containing protein n=1 Tax=Streptomyces sp. NPDC086023 TaxID=3365746 RepID=UPI0037D2E930